MKRVLSLFLTLLLCLSLFACGKQPEAPPAADPSPVETPPPEPVTPPEEEPVPAEPLPGEQAVPEIPEVILGSATTIFKNENDDPVLQVDMTLPACEGLPQIDSYYKAMCDDLTATYGLSREDAIRHKADLESMGQEFIPWAVEITFDVTRNDGKTLSVLREVYENLGGAHPLVTYRAETFDVASQGRLLLGDLFQSGADYQSRLNGVDEADQLNFALTDDSLVLCTETGTISIPLSDLSDILKPRWVK